MQQRLTYNADRERYEYATDGPQDRFRPKAAKLRYDPPNIWWTEDVDRAAQLRDEADPATEERIEAELAKRHARFELSSAPQAVTTIDLPKPDGEEYLPFQAVGITYALPRKRVLIADEMGLGKTVETLGVINALHKTGQRMYVLVICPASLRINWSREAAKWLVSKPTIEIVQGSARDRVCEGDGDIFLTIINYDVLKRHHSLLHCRTWDVMVADEAHYLKNPKAARTVAVFGKRGKENGEWTWKEKPIEAERKLFLTGTPILNRPVEVWTIAHECARDLFPSWWEFVHEYCAAVRGRYGLDVSGASNMDKFQRLARETFMLRRLKRDVLKELPAKRRHVMELPTNGAGDAVEKEQAAWNRFQEKIQELRAVAELAKAAENDAEYEAAVLRLQEDCQLAFTEIAKERHRVALSKVPAVVQVVTDLLESGEKLVLFAHHRDVIEALGKALAKYGVVTVTGATSMKKRQENVDRFQTDEGTRLFIGNMKAAGVGITLTAASTVVFAELDWTPANVTQAEDRCHRIGQLESVLVYHMVFDGSIDARIARALVAKQRVIDAALDDAVQWEEPELVAHPTKKADEPATGKVRRAQIKREAPKLTKEQIEAVHLGLRMLAGMCDGARNLDGAGFNKMDTRIGKELAAQATISARQAALGQRFITKYRRQLPPELVEQAKNGGTK
jgi:SWI/SNF-related matrix-associated actin-dependent regulator 1 of chromatin subfamily A